MENKEPSGEGAAKQEAAGEEYKQEAEQFLKLHRQDKVLDPSGLFPAYLLFVGAVTGVGVLASYTHHDTTANFFLIVSIVLVFIAAIGALWYLMVTFRGKKSSEKIVPKVKGLAEMIARSRAGMALIRFTNTRFANLFLYLLYIVIIGLYIGLFPRMPRFSLTFISFSILILISMATSGVAAVRKKEHEKDTMMLANAVVAMYERMKLHETSIKDVAEITRKYIVDTGQSTSEVHSSIMDAIDATNRSVQELHTTTTLLMAENLLNAKATPDQLDARSAGDDESDEPSP